VLGADDGPQHGPRWRSDHQLLDRESSAVVAALGFLMAAAIGCSRRARAAPKRHRPGGLHFRGRRAPCRKRGAQPRDRLGCAL